MQTDRQLVDELLRVAHLFGGSHLRSATSGLMQGEKALLFCLYQHRETGGMAPSSLSDRLMVKRPAVTIMLNSLEDKGYVRRERDPCGRDRRKIQVFLTAQGIQTVEEQFKNAQASMLYLVKTLGPEDTRRLIDLGNRVFQIMEEYYAGTHGGQPPGSEG